MSLLQIGFCPMHQGDRRVPSPAHNPDSFSRGRCHSEQKLLFNSVFHHELTPSKAIMCSEILLVRFTICHFRFIFIFISSFVLLQNFTLLPSRGLAHLITNMTGLEPVWGSQLGHAQVYFIKQHNSFCSCLQMAY